MQAHRSGQLFPILMATWLTESSALADAPLPARDDLQRYSPSGPAGVEAHRRFLGRIVVEGSVKPLCIKKIEQIHRVDGSPKAIPSDPDLH